jgi:hypothetical protein
MATHARCACRLPPPLYVLWSKHEVCYDPIVSMKGFTPTRCAKFVLKIFKTLLYPSNPSNQWNARKHLFS